MFRLSPEIEERMARVAQYTSEQRAIFAALTDDQLADSAKFWMQYCDAPKRIEPGRPVYDSTFWHAIVPEMIRRLKK